MRKLILPDKRDGYIPSGIYKLPLNERSKEFIRLFEKNKDETDLSEYRMKVYREMKGELK